MKATPQQTRERRVGSEIVCPSSLWEILKRKKCHSGTPRSIQYSQLIENAGGLRSWEKHDFQPRMTTSFKSGFSVFDGEHPIGPMNGDASAKANLFIGNLRSTISPSEAKVVKLLQECLR